jgi:colicin import membrane protein
MFLNNSKIGIGNIFKSLGLHIGIIVLALLYNYVSHQNPDNSKVIIIIKESVRVDLVGMPKFSLQELKKMQLPDLNSTVQESELQIDKNNSEVKLKKVGKINLKNLLSGISKRKIQKKKNKKKTKQNMDTTALRNLVLEGNKISKGSALTGDIKENGDLTIYEGYAASVAPHVRKFWRLPSYLLDEGLKCRVKIFVNSDGSVLSQHVLSSSGNSEFDSRALKAVKLSSPFNVPEKSILRNVKINGIVLAFPIL